jgi:hypothetical protein
VLPDFDSTNFMEDREMIEMWKCHLCGALTEKGDDILCEGVFDESDNEIRICKSCDVWSRKVFLGG